MKLTLGFSPCPNDTFIFDALVHGRIDMAGLSLDVRLCDVETLNRLALNGELDMTKLSYHAFGHVMDRYVLLNSGSALGQGCGPLLIAKQMVENASVNQMRIAIPGELTTAHFLFGLEYPDAINKVFMPFDQIEEAVLNGQVEAGVIIHENRFTYAAKGLVELCDLGERWEQRSGFPIPLGGIAVKRSLPDKVIRQLDQLVRKSVEYGFEHPQASREYIKEHAQEMDDAVIDQHIGLYVNQYSVELGIQGRAAIEMLLKCAGEAGLIGPVKRPLII